MNEISNIEAEQFLIACLVYGRDKEMASDIFIECRTEDFTVGEYIQIYNTAYRLFINDKPIELVTLTEADKDLKLSTLVDLTRLLPSYSNYKHYIAIVKKNSYARQLVIIADSIKALAPEDPYKTRDRILNELTKIGETVTTTMTEISVTINEISKEIADRKAGVVKKHEIKTPYSKLNYNLKFTSGELYVLAARPGIGKSAFASEILLSAALKQNKTVAFFNLEMSDTQIVKRMFSSRLEKSVMDIENGNVNDDEFKRVAKGFEAAQIFINTQLYNIEGIVRACKVAKKRGGLDLAIIDYLQLIGSNTGFKSRNDEVAFVSRQLKLLAMELEIPVIALSQMNRGIEQSDREPQLSDLRESGAIEQDASAVIFLHRQSNIEEKLNFTASQRYIKAIIAKNRNGATGCFYLRFEGDKMRFVEIDKDGSDIKKPYLIEAKQEELTDCPF